MKNQDRSNRLQKNNKNTLKRLARSPRTKILALSGLVSASVLVGALLAWRKPPSNSVTVNNFPISTSIQQPVVTKVDTNIDFPAAQLPTTFKGLPVPQLISDTRLVHKSTLEKSSLIESTRLQKIIENTVKLVTNEKLKKEDLSIAVIDVNRNEIAGYQSNRLEYPASVAKLFWAVALYEKIDHKLGSNTKTFDALAEKMIVESDNEAASFIVDSITKAPSLAKNLEKPILFLISTSVSQWAQIKQYDKILLQISQFVTKLQRSRQLS
jgi:hypothetical protein